MKCFKIRNGAVDSIMLNEACSSGCGSFIETFAKALGYNIADFSKLGLFAKQPGEPGLPLHRVHELQRQAGPEGRRQRGGYLRRPVHLHREKRHLQGHPGRLRRRPGPAHRGPGRHLPTTTRCCAPLSRSWGRDVTRPTIAGHDGRLRRRSGRPGPAPGRGARLLSAQDAGELHPHRQARHLRSVHQPLLPHRQHLRRRAALHLGQPLLPPPGGGAQASLPDLMRYKYQTAPCSPAARASGDGSRGRIGIPFGLNMYENLPFWFDFLHQAEL